MHPCYCIYNSLYGDSKSVWDSLKFHYTSISYEDFAKTYTDIKERELFFTDTKENKLYFAWKATTTALYHMPKGVLSIFRGNLDELQQHTYHCIRNIEEAVGWITSLFFETLGLYLVADSLFHQKAYWVHERTPCFTEKNNFDDWSSLIDKEILNKKLSEFLGNISDLNNDGYFVLTKLGKVHFEELQAVKTSDCLADLTVQDLCEHFLASRVNQTPEDYAVALCPNEKFLQLTTKDLRSYSPFIIKRVINWKKERPPLEEGINPLSIPLLSAPNLKESVILQIIEETGQGYILSICDEKIVKSILSTISPQKAQTILPSLPLEHIKLIPISTINQLDFSDSSLVLAHELFDHPNYHFLEEKAVNTLLRKIEQSRWRFVLKELLVHFELRLIFHLNKDNLEALMEDEMGILLHIVRNNEDALMNFDTEIQEFLKRIPRKHISAKNEITNLINKNRN